MPPDPLPPPLPHDAHQCVERATRAFLRARDEQRDTAALLTALAHALDAHRDDVLTTAGEETALTREELLPEFARTTGTLRMFATLTRSTRSAARARIDPALPASESVGPPHDLRSMCIPLGPVLVFPASNFPLAYGVLGTDSSSALAAGCSVIVKGHPAHPRTGALLARIASGALRDAGAPDLLTYVPHTDARDHTLAEALIAAPLVAAIGFTGSIPAGTRVAHLAASRPRPIPAFCEMGSVNPVLIGSHAAEARGDAIAHALADSILARVGQQCTRPGLIVLDQRTDACAALVRTLAARIQEAPPRAMLAPWILEAYERRVRECAKVLGVRSLAPRQGPADATPRTATPTLLGTSLATFIANPTLRDEVFGPCALVVDAPVDRWPDVLPPGSLTLTLHLEPADSAYDARTIASLAHHAGRIIINGVPTGVRVAGAMVHSGPYPACNHPESTAVGPFAMERWQRAICFQNAPAALLPDVLRD